MPRDERFSARDKKTHKMTKDGLVERNETTGEEQRVSQRGQDFQIRQPQAEQQSFSGRDAPSGRSRRQHQPSHEPPAHSPQYEAFEQNTLSQPTDFRQNDAPIRTDAYTASTQDSIAKPSLLDQVREVHSHPESGETTGGKQSGTAYQRHFQDEPTASADTAVQAPIKEPTTPDTAPNAAGRDTTPTSDSPPRRAYKPPVTSDAATPETTTPESSRLIDDSPRSRLKFGEGARTKEHAGSSRQRDTRYAQKFAEHAQKSESGTSSASDAQQGAGTSSAAVSAGDSASSSSPKLKFAADELPPEPLGKKLTSARRKAERIDGKLDKAREKLPARRRPAIKKEVNHDSGKVQRRLRFEKEVKTQRQHLKGALPIRPVKAGANTAVGYAHKKLYQVEEENVGTKAAHRTEMAAEGTVRSAYRFHKTRPYRRVAKLQQKSMRANVKLSYQKALNDNPQLRSNLLSRFLQKQKIKRQYAKAAREAKRAGSSVKQAGSMAAKAAQAVAGFFKRHPVAASVIALLLLLVFVIMAMFSSCSNMAGGGMSAIFMSSYTAGDADIDNAELAYIEWETDLQFQISNAESNHTGYDEYRYAVDDIGHNPYELMAYLTAKYHDFTFAQVEADLRVIFAEQYTLEFVPEVEIRYRTEYYYDDDGELQSEEVPYEWHILNVILTARSFTDVVSGRMDADQREHYALLMETKGNRQYTLSPFDFDWIPYISCYYGWRVHPISGEKDNHRAVDIAVAAGTEIIAAHDGVVTTATCHDSYGYYIALDNGEGLITKYAHCSQLLVSAGQTVKQGDVIALVGSTGDSTGAHLHFEVIKDGVYLNPLFFSESIDDGTGGSPVIPDYPGEPMGDGTFAVLMQEAQQHLGKPYVFGAKGPDMFDCSGFVSWTLTHSGVSNIQTNAQGLYNASTPVSSENARPGDLIFFHSTYSTSNTVTHVGIYIGNGQMIHAGNPIQYASINTTYWQNHFYAFGRISG